MYMNRDIFEEVKICNTNEETANVGQALTDYMRQLQCMTGIWGLQLRRLRLEVDSESAEVTNLHHLLSEEPLTWETELRPFSGTIWADDTPWMRLVNRAKSGCNIRLLADFYLTVDDSVGYGMGYWVDFLEQKDTPALRQFVSYRCMDYDELESDYFLYCYDREGMRMMPLSAEKEDLPSIPMWSTKEFSIFAHPGKMSLLDGAAVERAEALAQCFQERYMMGEGILSASQESFFLVGPLTVSVEQMEELFQDAEAIRQCLVPSSIYTETEATFVPNRTTGNDTFALVHVSRQEKLDVECCAF